MEKCGPNIGLRSDFLINLVEDANSVCNTMAGLQSSQNFVRALKGSNDPPTAGGPFKFELADQAWGDSAFRIPNKAEVIVDWILTKFFKEKAGKDSSIVDVRYWKLLHNIISKQEDKTWLKRWLGRMSIIPIVSSFITNSQQSGYLGELATSCISILWPLGTQKFTTEVLLACWTTYLTKGDTSISKIGALVTESYRNSLSNSSNRKKIHTTFIHNQAHLQSWIEQAPTNDSILLAGIDTLFNVDVLRQIQDSKSNELPLFHSLLALENDHRALVLDTLPQLFTHYVAALKKHKGSIFSGASSNAGGQRPEVNAAAFQFFGSCQNILDLRTRDAHTWRVACRLLDIVEQEHLYLSDDDEAALLCLMKNMHLGLGGLSECWKAENSKVTEAILDSFSVLIKIDCDLILPAVPRILTHLLCIPTPHHTFLEFLLEYHIKTRTLDDHLGALFACLPLKSFPLPLDAHERYHLCLSSPLLNSRHLEKLSKAVYQFLTPGQCHKTAQSTVEVLTDVHEQYKAGSSRKKRKSEAMEVEPSVNSNTVAVTFALSARLAQVVLGSLPLPSLQQTQKLELVALIAQFFTDFVQQQSSKLVKRLAKSDEETSEKKKRKHKDGDSEWGAQVVLASILRLQYGLERAQGLGIPVESDEKVGKRMVEVLKRQNVLPELALEISRILLLHAPPINDSGAMDILDPVLTYIESDLPNDKVSWSGQPHQLVKGSQASLAMLHLLLERWLAVIDVLATPQQLSRLVKIIMQLPLELSEQECGNELVPQHLLLRVLRSAQFWELHNIRVALLAQLLESTSPLDEKASESSVVSTYRLLLFFPVEYFTKSCRAELVKRALTADRRFQPYSTPSKVSASGMLRLFLERTFSFTGIVEQQSTLEMADFLLHLLQKPKVEVDRAYIKSTLDLASLYFLEVFRQCSRSAAGEVIGVLSSYAQYQLYDGSQSIRAESVIRMVEIVTKEVPLPNFSTENQAAFKDLHSHLSSQLQQSITDMLEQSILDNLSKVPSLLAGWHAVLSLGQWLGLQDTPQFYGGHLAKKFNPFLTRTMENVTTEWVDDVAVMVVGIIMQELHYRDPMERNEQLDLGVGVYLSCLRTISSAGRNRVDDYLGRASRLLSPENYGHILDLIGETLSQASIPQEALVNLIHLASVFLREHPQNTLKITQSFVTNCINAFNGNEVFVDGPIEVRLQVLGLLNQHCSERPAALRLLDLGGLWLLLSRFLSPSSVHDASTSPEMFHKIVSIANAIIRLRRDLVVPMIPHLGMVLRQLLSSMRSCRPQLGSRQTELVLNSQPRWMAADKALGLEEAKALARLLETLTTKTVPRTHGGHGAGVVAPETQKAESLANAFSKHAAYVLKAYIEAMNEPLCVMSLDVRKELAPGLYALCGMINEHSRDAMMVSALDAGGKATLKALWREYEKQRYVGKG